MVLLRKSTNTGSQHFLSLHLKKHQNSRSHWPLLLWMIFLVGDSPELVMSFYCNYTFRCIQCRISIILEFSVCQELGSSEINVNESSIHPMISGLMEGEGRNRYGVIAEKYFLARLLLCRTMDTSQWILTSSPAILTLSVMHVLGCWWDSRPRKALMKCVQLL